MSKRDLKENTNLSAVSDNFQSMIDLKRAFFRKVTRRFLINSYASFNCELDNVVYNERDIYLQLFQFRGKKPRVRLAEQIYQDLLILLGQIDFGRMHKYWTCKLSVFPVIHSLIVYENLRRFEFIPTPVKKIGYNFRFCLFY